MFKKDNGIAFDKISNAFDIFLDKLDDGDKSKRDKEARKSDDNPHGFVDIVTFVEDPYYLNIKLYPLQMLPLKVFYLGTEGNKHLEITEDSIPKCSNCVWYKNRLTKFKSPCLNCVRRNEEKVQNFFKEEIKIGRISRDDMNKWSEEVSFRDRFQDEMMILRETYEDKRDVLEQIIKKAGMLLNELVLVCGRRGGKSLDTSVVALYEAYRLIEMGDPQSIYGLLPNDVITILNVASGEDAAKDAVFDKIKNLVLNSPYFKKKVNKQKVQTQSLKLYTPADQEKNEELEKIGMPPLDGSIRIVSGSSNADTQVGKTVAVVIMDEVSGMISDQDSKMSDYDLYRKLKPSIATFGDAGKIVILSNPLGKEGLLWDLYQYSLSVECKSNPLMFQLPTRAMNPQIDKEFLEEEKEKDPNTYIMQYEAEFFDGAREPYLHPEIIDDAFKPYRSFKTSGDPRIKYFAHADPAINTDNYAFVITHLEDSTIINPKGGFRKKVIVDHIKLWQPEKGKKVNIESVDNYIIDMTTRFNIQSLSYDNWNSESSIQKMESMGVPVVKTGYTTGHQMLIYETLLHLFQEGLIEFYWDGDPEHFCAEAKRQLKYLEKKYSRKSFRIEAVNGEHDDIPDAVAGAAWMALSRVQYGKLPATRTMLWGGDVGARLFSNTNSSRRGKYG